MRAKINKVVKALLAMRPKIVRALKVCLIIVAFVGAAFAGGLAGGAIMVSDGGGPELTDLVRNWEATVAVRLPNDLRASGVIVSRQGHVLTCAHVITLAEGGEIHVDIEDGPLAKSYLAEVVAVDEEMDLGLLRISVNFPRPALIAEGDVPPYPGDEIYGVGYPSELGSIKTISRGSVRILRYSAIGENVPLSAQDTLALYGRFENGYSGSGIYLQGDGRLAGLVSLELWTGRFPFWMRGTPLAIPASRFRPFLDQNGVVYNGPDASWWDTISGLSVLFR